MVRNVLPSCTVVHCTVVEFALKNREKRSVSFVICLGKICFQGEKLLSCRNLISSREW